MSNIPPIEDGYIDSVIKSSGPLKPNLHKTQGIELRALVKLLRDRLEGEISDHYLSNQAALSQKANIDQVVLNTTKLNGRPLSGDIVLDKSDVGLGSVDNTSDLDKPLSSFAQAALALKADMADVNGRLSTKVDKVIGKQLSAEDFSTSEKDKLANIQAGATSNQNDSYLLAREHHTGTQGMETITGLRSELDSKVNQSEKGQGNGIATLDGSGKIPLVQLSAALLGSVNYQGNYNAAANTPALPQAAGNKGKYFVVSTAGNQQSLELNIGDWIISNGNIWERVDNNNKVTSVNGRQGSVMIGKGDIGLANVDNTSDVAKPVSTAQQAALNVKANNNGSNATGLWGIDISGNANTVSLLNGTQIFSAINGSNLVTNTLNVNIFGRSAFSESLSNGSADMSFHWQGQSGQPDWLWGGNAPGDMYVYNPNEFHVASAGRLRNIMVHDFDVPTGFGFLEGAGTNIPNQPQYGSWAQGIQFSTNNNPTYANQLVFNENGALSTRYKAGAGWSGWDRIITASQLGSGAYLNASGGDDAWTGDTIVKYNSAGFIRTASKNYPQSDIPTSILGSKVGDDYMWSFTPQALRDFLNYNGSQIYTSIDNRDGDLEVAKYMRWKQHGNGHVIFDASAGIAPNGAVIDRNNPQVKVDDVVNPVLMGWNGTNTYGVRVQQANNSSEWNGREVNWNDNSVSSINNIVVLGNDGIVGLTSSSILANWLGFSLNNQWITGAGAGDMNLLSTFESYLYTDGGVNAPSPYSQVINIGVGTTSAIATQLASYYGHIDAYYLRSKYDTTNTWKPWRQIVTTDIGDLQNTLIRGNIAYGVTMGIDQYEGQPAPNISLAIGDNDTGFQRNGDGSTLYFSNRNALYNLAEAGSIRNFLGLNTNQSPIFLNTYVDRLWASYGSSTMNTYSWTNAATTTNSIEIVNRGSGEDNTTSPTLAFHRYGSGGPQFRLDPTGTNVLYLESSGANSARNGAAYGGGSNLYFQKLYIDGGLQVAGNLHTPGISNNWFFNGGYDNATYSQYNVGLKLWNGFGLTSYDDITRAFYDSRAGVWDVKGDFRIDGRSVTDMVTRLQSTSHNGIYYLENTWDGVHWWLRSNHGAPVKVGRADYADNAGTWNNQVWQDANKSGAVTFMTNNAGGWGYSTLAQVQESLGVTSAVGRDFNNFVFGTNGTATLETNDFNTLLKSGFYNSSQPGSTAPTNSWHHLINSAHSGSTPTNIYNFQLSADFFSGDLFYIRTIVPAGPNPWRRITTDDRLANSAFTGMDVNPSGNTIVQRNNAGHAFATYFNSTDGTVEGFTPAALYAYNGTDGYLRKVNAGGIINFLNINLQCVADRGNHEIWSNDNTSLGFNEASLIIREAQHGASSTFLAPRIGFHWGGVVASQIRLESDGSLVLTDNPGTSRETIRVKDLDAVGKIVGNFLYSTGSTDSHNYRVRGNKYIDAEGGYMLWNDGQFGGTSFINQKGGGTGGFKWQSSDTANGRNDLMRLEEDGQLYLYSNLIVGEGKNSSSIIMRDTDETERALHCNSNRIGFLNAGGGWGSYCNNDGGWISDNYVSGGRLFSGYDSGVAGSVSANNWFRSSGQSGWYSSDYGGGIYMTDSTWVRVYANKGFWVDSNVVAGTGTNGGYANSTYNQGHNNIWRLNSDPEYGLAYYQGMSGEDRIGFHFGNRNSPVFYVNTSGQVFASGGFYDTSDKRIKILSTEVFDTRSIKVRTYYKNDKLETGYFAQDVQEVMPHAVGSNGGGLLTLNYTQVLVAKVANLEEDIRLLQEEINTLKQGI